MKKNLRGKIREFVQSEEGKVGIKSPLTLGVATGGILLAQVIIGTSQAAAADDDCWDDGDCHIQHHECHDANPFLWKGTCHD